jgi:hypothetical protein
MHLFDVIVEQQRCPQGRVRSLYPATCKLKKINMLSSSKRAFSETARGKNLEYTAEGGIR